MSKQIKLSEHKNNVLHRIMLLEEELKTMPKFKGKAQIKRKITKHKRFLILHKTEEHLERLILQDLERMFEGADDLLADRDWDDAIEEAEKVNSIIP